MRFIAALAATVAVAGSVALAAPTAETDVSFPHPFLVKRAPSTGDRHMVDLTLDKSLFSSLGNVVKDILPPQVEALQIPDIHGELPSTGVTGEATYNITNIKFSGVQLTPNTAFTLHDGSVVLSIGLEAVMSAKYNFRGRVGFSTKDASGDLSITAKGGHIGGNFLMRNNQRGGLAVSVANVKSNIETFDVKLSDSWWMSLVTRISSTIAKPIMGAAIGTVVSTAVPPLINVLFENQLALGLTLPNGERLALSSKIVGEPAITSENVKISIDLIRG